jgi:predicted ATPase
MVLWTLGYPEAALADAQRAVKDARKWGRLLPYAVAITSITVIHCGDYATANEQLDEAIAWADEKGAVFWKALLTRPKGWILAVTKASDAVQTIAFGIALYRSTGSTAATPLYLSYLAVAHADNGQLDYALRHVDEAMVMIKTTKERWFEAEVNRIAGEIALKSPEHDAAKAEENFERALAVARQQQTKSFELRAAMSLARLWRDQGKVQQARELLAPVYGWFTEGFDTLDLKEAKTLLEELASGN